MASILDPFLRKHAVFRRDEALAFLEESLGRSVAERRIRGLLGYQMKTGGVVSLRHGLYATSSHGHQALNPYLIAGKASEDAVIGFQAALAWHVDKGGTPPKKIHVYATGLRADEGGSPEESLFIPVQARRAPGLQARTANGVQKVRVQGCFIRVTTLERTIVDVLDRPDLLDDADEVWKLLAGLSGPLDLKAMADYLGELGCTTTTARVGYFLSGHLERFGLDGLDLQLLPQVPTSPHPWVKGAKGSPHPVWNLIVPTQFKLANAEAFTLESLYGTPSDYSTNRIKGGKHPDQLDLLHELPKRFGKKYKRFREGQEAIIRAVLQGRDALAILPTGAGKSLTYQFPAKFLNGVTLVVSPLLSLMEDQVREARSKRLGAIALGSKRRNPKSPKGKPASNPSKKISPGTGIWGNSREVATLLGEGKLDLLFVSPEVVPRLLKRLPQLKKLVTQIVIDEAHLICTWGRDFRDGYKHLGALRDEFPFIPVLALTATATPKVRTGIIGVLRMKEGGFEEQRLPVARPGLFLRRHSVANGEFKTKYEVLLSFIKGREGQPGIIFCPKRKETEKIEDWLRKKAGYKSTRAYHAGLKDWERRAVQNAFVIRKRCGIVAATVAFGMGVNKKDVRWVVHFGLPGSLEGYVQEVGRAGRDGERAECLLIHAPSDPNQWRQKFKNAKEKLDPALDPAIRKEKLESLKIQEKELQEVIAFANRRGCLHEGIGDHFHESTHRCRRSCEVCRATDWDLEDLLQTCPPSDSSIPEDDPRGNWLIDGDAEGIEESEDPQRDGVEESGDPPWGRGDGPEDFPWERIEEFEDFQGAGDFEDIGAFGADLDLEGQG